MAKTRPPYPAEFRQQMVDLVHTGRTPAELAREFGCTAQSIVNWVGQAAADSGHPLPGKDVLTTTERAELSRLRRQVRQLQMERDILAKATAWFAARGEKTMDTYSAKEPQWVKPGWNWRPHTCWLPEWHSGQLPQPATKGTVTRSPAL